MVLRLEISCVVRGRGPERLEDPDPTPDAAHSPAGPSLWLVPGAQGYTQAADSVLSVTHKVPPPRPPAKQVGTWPDRGAGGVEGRNQLPAPSSKARRARTATTTARQEGARCTGRPELRGPTARQGAAPRPSPGAPGGFPRSVPRAPADRSGRFQPPPVPRPTAWVSGETEGRADLGGQGRRGLGDRNKGLEAYFGGKTCESMGGGGRP